MAGSFITISVEDAAARAMLNKLGQMDTAPLMRRLGERIQAWTQDRFDANQQQAPDGTPWAKLNPKYAQNKPRHLQNRKLTLSGHLRKSIRWQLLDSQSVLVGTNVKYAAIHQFGGTIRPKKGKALAFGGRFVQSVTIPARPYLGISEQDNKEIREIIKDWVLEQQGD
ncbi:MAG: phage virion morphogenesis protein [Acidovorax sp.]|nr:phage virion morphogenesis protein [Acidovorax sp.]